MKARVGSTTSATIERPLTPEPRQAWQPGLDVHLGNIGQALDPFDQIGRELVLVVLEAHFAVGQSLGSRLWLIRPVSRAGSNSKPGSTPRS